MMWRRVALAIGAAVGIGAPYSAHAQTVKRFDRPELVRLTVKGVESVDERALLASLAITPSRCINLFLKPFCLFSHASVFYRREYLDHEELARDMVRARVFYFERGYREMTIDTVVTYPSRHSAKVTLVIREGAPIKVSNITITQQTPIGQKPILRRKDIVNALKIRREMPLDLLRIDSTQMLLRDQLWEFGYANATVDTASEIDSTARRALVRFQANPGPKARVESIDIEGLKKIDKDIILKSLSFSPGDVYRRSDVLNSQRTLYESNLFRSANIEVADSADSLKQVKVIVQESKPQVARVSTGFNTIDFVQVEGRYTNYNWFGKARRFTAQATFGNLFAKSLNGNGIFYNVGNNVAGGDAGRYLSPTFTISLESRRPWWLSPKNEIALGVFTHRRSSPGIFVDRGFGLSATFTRTVAIKAPISLNYRFEKSKTQASDVYFCVNFGVCDDATLSALRGNQRMSPIALSGSFDRTNDPFEPKRGSRGQLDAETAIKVTASDFRYGRISAGVSKFVEIGRGVILASHLQVGFVNAYRGTMQARDSQGIPGDVLHPRKRFYAGGANSVRGFAESQLGPRVLTIPFGKLAADSIGCPDPNAIQDCQPDSGVLQNRDFEPRPLGGNILYQGNVELRIPLMTGFIGAIFIDGAYLAQKTTRDLPQSERAITPGIGGRYLSPVGPIRVDLGINPVRTERLPVITEIIDSVTNPSEPVRRLVRLNNPRTFKTSVKGGLGGLLDRLTLHLSIGEAF